VEQAHELVRPLISDEPAEEPIVLKVDGPAQEDNLPIVGIFVEPAH